MIFLVSTTLAQTTDEMFEHELQGESIEENEEILSILKSKISIEEFINNAKIYTLFISENQYQGLFEHIQKNGQLVDLLELQSIQGFSYIDYLKLKKIIQIDPTENINTNNTLKINCFLFYQSDVDKKYTGGIWGNYQQAKISLKNRIKGGIAREVDIGEKTNEILGDHCSFYLNKKWNSKEFTIGEYQVYHGFGLLVGQGYALSFGNGGINNLLQNKWLGNASRTEINTMRGGFFSYKYKKLNLTIGYSNQKIDTGTPTGYHRTINEIIKKNSTSEQLLLSSFEYQTFSYKLNVLGINNFQNNNIGYSLGIQYYFRNTISFMEYSIYEKLYAYTFGAMILIGKDIQLNLSHTHFQNNYRSPWQSYTTQGFSENDGNGFIINFGFPMKRKWQLSLTTRINEKVKLDEKEFGRDNKFTQILQVNKTYTSKTKVNFSLISQRNNFKSKTIRAKVGLSSALSEDIQQEHELLINTSDLEYSKALSYFLKFKRRAFNWSYSIAYFQITNNLPIYYTIENTSKTRQTLGIYNSGILQTIGVNLKIIRRFTTGINVQYLTNSNELNSKYKLTFSFQYL